jgi:predicted ribosomally synthesized peptide with nif11-like leader
MSENQFKDFIEAAKNDAGLRGRIRDAADMHAVIAIAKQAGFVISVHELKCVQSEISDDELEGVAGGYDTSRTGGCLNTVCVAMTYGGDCPKNTTLNKPSVSCGT